MKYAFSTTSEEEKYLDQKLWNSPRLSKQDLWKTYWKLISVRTARRHLNRQLRDRREKRAA